jgi:hypothetical protein
MDDSNFERIEKTDYSPHIPTVEKGTMLRIHIKWTDRMLMAGAAACDIKIEQLNPLTSSTVEVLFKARGKVERYCHGYENCEWGPGMTGEIFDKYVKPYLDCMMLSYRRGMCLENQDFHWIQDWRTVK